MSRKSVSVLHIQWPPQSIARLFISVWNPRILKLKINYLNCQNILMQDLPDQSANQKSYSLSLQCSAVDPDKICINFCCWRRVWYMFFCVETKNINWYFVFVLYSITGNGHTTYVFIFVSISSLYNLNLNLLTWNRKILVYWSHCFIRLIDSE